MTDVFLSYARPDEAHAKRVADAFRAEGYDVWRDNELPAHRSYADVIEERLKDAKAVVVLWSGQAVKSQWVRAEADAARAAGTLVQASLDGTIPPMPFNQVQCADLDNGGPDGPGWQKVKSSVISLAGSRSEIELSRNCKAGTSICVLPFQNMSGDPEQEYFSDGIAEDITTDLSKVSALAVTARNTAFTFKGRAVNVCKVAQALSVSHVLEGSVRKAGNRVRITAQLVDGKTGDHVWADRYDRGLTDIFEIQDELSRAIVDALKIRLLPEEERAIASRGTLDVEAYNHYLMARQQWVGGSFGSLTRDEAIVRICQEATAMDPGYAEAWALMALAQAELRFWHARDVDPLPAARRALSLNPRLAEPHCVIARYHEADDSLDEAAAEIDEAFRLNPESWEVNREAACMIFRQGRLQESIPYFERATALADTDWHNPSMLFVCYRKLGDEVNVDRAMRIAFERVEKALTKDPTNGAAIANGVAALAHFGEGKRAREWARRGLLLDPDNVSMHYNLACSILMELNDPDEALRILEIYLKRANSAAHIRHVDVDPDMDSLRHDARFNAMLTEAKKRLGIYA